ncbi:MAG: exodeoxyribonuclease VII small subunit [Acidimicrobiales bacterium]
MTEQPSVPSATGASISYSAAITEVEDILGELEGNVVDVDHLAERVRRASELLSICRERLSVVEVDVAALVDALDPGDEQPNGTPGTTQ